MRRRRGRWLEWLLLGLSLPLLLVPFGAVVVTGVTALVLNLGKRVSPKRGSAFLTASIPILGLTPVVAATTLTIAIVLLLPRPSASAGGGPWPPVLGEIKAIPGIARIDLSASFTDADPGDSHEAVVDWGDGTSSALGPATSPIRLCHTYAAPGVYSLRIVVTDSFGLEASSRGEFVAGVPAAYGTSEPC